MSRWRDRDRAKQEQSYTLLGVLDDGRGKSQTRIVTDGNGCIWICHHFLDCLREGASALLWYSNEAYCALLLYGMTPPDGQRDGYYSLDIEKRVEQAATTCHGGFLPLGSPDLLCGYG